MRSTTATQRAVPARSTAGACSRWTCSRTTRPDGADRRAGMAGAAGEARAALTEPDGAADPRTMPRRLRRRPAREAGDDL